MNYTQERLRNVYMIVKEIYLVVKSERGKESKIVSGHYYESEAIAVKKALRDRKKKVRYSIRTLRFSVKTKKK